jgi:radical SAM superfamily enzyme YgiQ (UPF0313 family)
MDSFSDELIEQLMKVRKSSLTFAPEAGSQKLRDVINKNISEDEILKACSTAFTYGINSVKLYFMLGLPTETDEDITAIAELAEKIVKLFNDITRNNNNGKPKPLSISISASTFIPKPFTPFQFVPQATESQILHKQNLLKASIRSKRRIDVSYNDYRTSFLEAVFARGNRKLSKVLLSAWKKGCKFDGWDDHFKWKMWMEAFEENKVDPATYAQRSFDDNEIMPWDHLDYMIDKKFLWDEYQKALEAVTTPNCRQNCSHCGISRNIGKCSACQNS